MVYIHYNIMASAKQCLVFISFSLLQITNKQPRYFFYILILYILLWAVLVVM